jgi:hypothetical protein
MSTAEVYCPDCGANVLLPSEADCETCWILAKKIIRASYEEERAAHPEIFQWLCDLLRPDPRPDHVLPTRE